MKLLIACPRQLLLVDSETADVELVESHRPEYYGVSWPEQGDLLCLGHSGIENACLGTLQSYMDSEQGWLSWGERRGPKSLSMTHQILCAGDRIIATNTGRNCLTVFRSDDFFYRHYWIDDVQWDRKGRDDTCGSHFNSLYLRDDELYVVAHNHDRGSELVRLAWPEMVVVSIHRTATHMAHNVWVTDEGQIIICDSMRGTLVDAVSNQVVWRCPMSGVVTRGLASDGQYVLVGHSSIGPRTERVSRDGRVWVIERSTWKTIDSLLLPGSGNVHEIRILDRPDLCHHGHVFRGRLQTIGRHQTIPTSIVAGDGAEPLRAPSVSTFVGMDHRIGAGNRWEQHVEFHALDDRRAQATDFSLATLSGISLRDVHLSADVDLRDAAARHAGIVARHLGPCDQEMVVAMLAKATDGNYAQLWQNSAGSWVRLGSRRVDAPHGLLELCLDQHQATVCFRGCQMLRTAVQGPWRPGAVGIRGAHGTVSNFHVQSLLQARAIGDRKSA